MALAIVAVHGAEVEPAIAVEAQLESVLQVAKELARAIDLAVREIAVEAGEIGLAIAAWEAVLGIEALLEMVPDTAAEARAQAAVGVLPAWAVRVGVLAELVVEVSVAAVAVVVAVVAGGSEVIRVSQIKS